jgi:3-hydroxybutyryl-CoA dehydrogenase
MKSAKEPIFIAGAGRMGRGMAVAFVYQGHQVTLVDIKERSQQEFEHFRLEVLTEINSHLTVLAASDVIPERIIEQLAGNVKIYNSVDVPTIWKEAKVIFEAVPEVKEIKKQVLTQICFVTSKDSLLASATSSFLVNELAEFVTNKERFLNTHWLNPAYLIPLVEVSPGSETSEEKQQQIFQLLEGIGKIPVKCAPSPGFIVPRIQALAMNEASRLVEEGVATVEDIDKATRLGFGLRFAVLGLLEFIDWGGADTLFHASHYLTQSLQSERFKPPGILEEKMLSGNIGLKTKEGFYHFDTDSVDDYQMETLKKFIDLLKHLGLIQAPKEYV